MLFASRMYRCLIAMSLLVGALGVDSAPAVEESGVEEASIKELSVDGANASNLRTLKDSIHYTLEHHPSLFAARQTQAIKRAEIDEIKSGYMPLLMVNTGIGREDSNNTTTRAKTGFGSDEYERREASVLLRQPLYDGRNSQLKRAGKQKSIQAEALLYEGLVSELALSAIKAHLQVMMFNHVLQDNIQNLQAHERIAKEVGIRARSGRDDRAKVNQISARLSLSLANVEAAKQKRHLASASYQSVVGVLPGSVLEYKPGMLNMPASLDVLLEKVMQQSVVLRAGQYAIQALHDESRAVRSTYLPKVFVEAGASWNDNLDGVAGRNNDAFVMLKMQYDLYDGGARYARFEQQRLAVQQAQFDQDATRREVQRQAKALWYQYLSLSRRISLLADYMESAQSTKSAYIKQFDIGQRSLIDLLDAENELLQARRMWQDANYELQVAKYEMLHLQGELLGTLSVGEDNGGEGGGDEGNSSEGDGNEK